MPQAPRLPPAEWEAQRARITELYVSQDKTLDEVIQIMAESGFHATKPQYIRKVNVNWKLQKNYTREKWQHASALVEKRQTEGKLTKLSIDGKVISEKKRKKELRRYHSSQIEQDLAYTPPSSNSKVVLIGNLPWLNFRESFNNLLCNQFPFSSPNRQYESLGSWLMEIPLLWSIHTKGETPTRLPLQAPPESISVVISKDLDTMRQRLLELIPEVANSIDVPSHQEPLWLQMFNSLVFLCSNNLVGTYKTTYDILQVAISSGFLIRMKHLLTMRGPTLEIFAVHLLFVALRVEGSKGIEFLRFLLESGVPAESLDPNDCRCSALYKAVGWRNRAAVQLLLTFKADPDAKIQGTGDDVLGSPLDRALHFLQDKTIAKILIDSGANVNSGYLKPLLQAVRIRSPDLTRYMLRMGADPKLLPAGGFSVIYFAISNHDLILVDLLIEAGINLNLLVEELQNADIEFLGDRSKSLVNPVITPIQLAVFLRNTEIVNLLIEGGALLDKYIEPEVFGSMGQTVEPWMLWTPLQISAEQGMEKTTRILLDAGAAVDVRHPKTSTALQLACRLPNRGKKKTELVEILLAGGADINAPPGEDEELTAMEAAAASGDHDVFKILLRKAGNPSPSDSTKRGSTVFQAALRLGSAEVMTYVLSELESQGRPVDFLDGTNYLEEAVATGNMRILEMLLDIWNYHALHWPQEFVSSALKAAIRCGFTHLDQVLDAGGFTIKGEETSSLICESIWDGDERTFDLLMQRSINPNLDCAQPGYSTPLWLAIHEGQNYMAQCLVNGGANPSQKSLAICRKGCCCGTRLEMPLKQAIYRFDNRLVEMLINGGSDIHCLIDGSQTPLLVSLERKNESAAVYFLSKGADPNAMDISDKVTALGLALDQNISLSTVRALIHYRADVNKPSTWGTPIQQVVREVFRHPSAQEKHELLLAAGADVKASNGRTAFQVAVSGYRVKLAKLLIGAGANVNAPGTGMTILQTAIGNRDTELAKLLIEAGADVNALGTGMTALQAAVSNRDTELAKLLIRTGANVNTTPIGYSALQLAITRNNVKLVKFLVQEGADIDASALGETALQTAANVGNLEVVKYLIDNDADVNAKAVDYRATALQYASMNGSIDMVTLLVDNGAWVNAETAPGYAGTALQLAVKYNRTQEAIYLIEKGASLEVVSSSAEKTTLLQLAAKQGNHRIVICMVENGAAADEAPPTGRGATALQFAAINGNIKMAVFLIEHGARVSAKGAEIDGRTALEGAAEHGRLDMVHLLLDNDEEPETIEERCCNAAEFAEAEHHDVIARILRNYKRP
ncbi:ankyrin protein [Fusarium globosum]|uniref:Ankyrin protein n=1 Tax=Fusarium globosum TaxID=78864 RepID=A0A8H6D5J8_9HYPO|nr:ankyrin protein [Fusarium globosum]